MTWLLRKPTLPLKSTSDDIYVAIVEAQRVGASPIFQVGAVVERPILKIVLVYFLAFGIGIGEASSYQVQVAVGSRYRLVEERHFKSDVQLYGLELVSG